ncbi:dimethylsulfonioproprionate lyase family protein [Ochrobactrum chromiisoli]|uniref:Dimethylsulfonioproprionate lyase family protein n=1 Tax=Ochrobactrum chromiisoli TaxID=2993941 RepID=A0ABT3QSK3_9HYPH|nr:dimethylsulfonioproprionate lyase family protein [Ochrobactrum chromiisoli]MCX2698564.1 dimethylsulfonioproprionate lyase family protein [Ochrobactrum chromiisoli]
MVDRTTELAHFVEVARNAFEEFVTNDSGRVSVDRIFGAIDAESGHINKDCIKLPVCAFLSDASEVETSNQTLLELVKSFLALEPDLSWVRRLSYDAATASENFPDGHGNCMVIGPGGLEDRPDVAIGASLLAPNVRYPDHTHFPEETYLVLSEGHFKQSDNEWFALGPGGSFYNPPGILHAMRSTNRPLLAFWALWVG